MTDVADAKDASEVGVHCSICRALDFLPFICSHCSSSFCKAHAAAARPEGHDCSSAPTSAVSASQEASSVTFKSLLPDRSRQAEGQPTTEELQKQAKKDAALAVLRKNFPSTSGSTAVSSSKTASKPPSKAVLLMKLKRSAKPADPRKGDKQVAPSDRRYLIAHSTETGARADIWLPKDCSCGKALDLLADLLRVDNRNGKSETPDSDIIRLAKATGYDRMALSNADNLGAVTADGDEVEVVRGS